MELEECLDLTEIFYEITFESILNMKKETTPRWLYNLLEGIWERYIEYERGIGDWTDDVITQIIIENSSAYKEDIEKEISEKEEKGEDIDVN